SRGAGAPTGPGRRPLPDQAQGPVERHVDQLATLGELMLAAAYADGKKVGIEVVAICEQLKEFVEAELLPFEVRRRLDRFDPMAFGVDRGCERLTVPDERDRLAVMRLVATVTGADHVLHPGETAYLRRVARAVGLDPDAVQISFK